MKVGDAVGVADRVEVTDTVAVNVAVTVADAVAVLDPAQNAETYELHEAKTFRIHSM